MKFKHVYCRDCNLLLAKYNTRYFSDVNIAELVRIHYHSHIKQGHSLVTRTADVLWQQNSMYIINPWDRYHEY